MLPRPAERFAVVLIGHGAPATDCPPELVGELMSLEWRQPHAVEEPQRLEGQAPLDQHGPPTLTSDPTGRAAELDEKIRGWPRHVGNDPYKAGLERLGEALRPLLPTDLFAIGYNEFCSPSVPETLEDIIRHGANHILVLPTMLTPGGVHSEKDIPRELDVVRRAHPDVRIDYLWPFDLPQVAALLAAHVTRAATRVHERSR